MTFMPSKLWCVGNCSECDFRTESGKILGLASSNSLGGSAPVTVDKTNDKQFPGRRSMSVMDWDYMHLLVGLYVQGYEGLGTCKGCHKYQPDRM